ncbi:hypothetical protein Tco_0929284 [Tanacetum coccineum]
MLIATTDEAGIHLDDKENDFMLMSVTRDDQQENLMLHEVNDSQIKLINELFSNSSHKQQKHAKIETINVIPR